MKQSTTEPSPASPSPKESIDWSNYKRKIEARIGGNLIDLTELKVMGYEELANSLERLGRFVNVKRSLLIASKKDGISVRFYTDRNVYFISAKLGKHWHVDGAFGLSGDGYLGAMVTCRTPEAGEWWNRGRDLADGAYSSRTLEHILLDIIGYEIEPLADWITEK